MMAIEYVIASYILGPGILGLFMVSSVVLLGYVLGKLEEIEKWEK